MNYLVYKHTSPSGKSYIGITSNYEQRCATHRESRNGCRRFASAIKKYGWDNFLHEILYDNLTLDQANFREQQAINEYRTLHPYGYNLSPGGGARELLPCTREKMSASHRRKCNSAESNAKRSSALKGRKKHPMSDATKQKLRVANLGKTQPEHVRAKIRNAAVNRILPGDNITYILTSPDGDDIVVYNLRAWCREMNAGLLPYMLVHVANKKYAQHRGWACRYLT